MSFLDLTAKEATFIKSCNDMALVANPVLFEDYVDFIGRLFKRCIGASLFVKEKLFYLSN